MRLACPALGTVLALAAVPYAGYGSVQPMTEVSRVPEAELRADFNGDEHEDSATIVQIDDRRELRVTTSVVAHGTRGENPPQILALDPYPLVDGTLAVKRGVLLFEELTGGTTAVASTHRFRWDSKLAAMRLIGLDATLYSRTFAHDGSEASWNLLTGDVATRTLKLNTGPGNAAYAKARQKRTRRPSQPIRLEQSPNGDDLLGWPGVN